MSRAVAQLLAAVLLSFSTFADSIWLEWDRNSDVSVAGYRVYYGQSSRTYDGIIEASNETAVQLPALAPGKTYFFAVTAYSAENLESDFSEEVSYAKPRTNEPPIAVSDSYRTFANTRLTVSAVDGVLDNDFDAEESTLSATLVNTVQHGVLALDASGAFDYSPTPGFVGNDSFTYRCTDGQDRSLTVAVTINVSAMPVTNQIPVAQFNSYQAWENTLLTINSASGLLGNDFDGDGDTLTVLLMGNPAHGVLNLMNNGSFTYLPVRGYTGTDTFTYSCTDGKATSGLATVSITVQGTIVTPPNQVPVAQTDFFETSANTLLTASSILSNDQDADNDPLTVLLTTSTANGILTFNSNGSFTYLPGIDFLGTDFFTYRVTDGKATSASTVVTIAIKELTNASTCPKCLLQLEQLLSTRGSSYNSLLQNVRVPENSTCLESALIQFYTLARTLEKLRDSELNVALDSAIECLAANLETEVSKRRTRINGLLASKWVTLADKRVAAISNQLQQAASMDTLSARTKKLLSSAASLRRVDQYIASGNKAPATLSNRVLWCRFSITGKTVHRQLSFANDGSLTIRDLDGNVLSTDAYVYQRITFDSAELIISLDGLTNATSLTLKFGTTRGKISGDIRGYFTTE